MSINSPTMETPAAIRRLAGIAALVSAALAVLVLVTWQFDAWRVATFGPDYVPMARITALVLLGLGSAMARRFLRPADPGGGRLAVGTAALGAAVAALELARWVVPFGLPWDAWIRGGQTTLGRFPLDRMSPLTAVGLLLTAGAILLSETAVAKQAWSRIVAALAAGIALLLAVIAVLGYASGRPIGYVRDDAPMALLTAIAVATLNAAWLLVHWQPPAVPAVAPDSDRIRRREQVFSRSLIGGTSAALLLLAIIGVAYLRLQDNEARDETYLHLDAITREKIEQISQWREERLDDARFLQRTPAVGVDIASFLANPADPRARGAVTDWLGNLRNRRIPYAAALLFDAGGNLRLAVPQNARAVGAGAARELAQALAGGDVIMGDIRRAAPTEPVYLDLLVPFPGNVAGTGAVVVLRVDPTAQLFPLLVNAPLSDAPGQFVLLRQEGDELVRLNDLPDQPGSALTWRRRIDQPDSVGLALARGEWGHREDLDENGTPMFVSFRRVPNSTWLFAARVAKAEAFAAHRGEMWTTSVLVGVLLGATVLGAGVISRQRRAVILQQALRSEHERETLARRLALITRHANDAILFFDESLRIVEANERALATYGYTAEEIRHRHITDLLDPSTAERAAADFATAMRSDGHIFETHHRRRDGSTFPVEVSARAIELDGRRHILSLVRDITERRQAEIEIRRVSELHSAMLKLPEAAEKLDEKAFLQQALKLAEDLTGSLISFIHLVNEDQQTLELVTWSRRTLEHYCHASHDQHYPVQQAGIWAEALRQRRTVVFNDYAAYEHKHGLPEGLSTLQRLISLPNI
jgi:PAS domain S-box-containing protein